MLSRKHMVFIFIACEQGEGERKGKRKRENVNGTNLRAVHRLLYLKVGSFFGTPCR